MGSHSPRSPSGMAAIRVCAAKVMMEKGEPNRESVYAAEGTAAHALGEKCLKTGANPHDFIGQKFGEFKHKNGNIEGFFVDGEMAEAVEVYVNHCRSKMNGKFYAIEQKYMLPILGEGEKGTSDFTALSDKILHVDDYKHGAGVPVDAYQNIQGLCYGIGAADQYANEDWHTLRITIVQPRAFGKPIKTWDVPKEDIIDWKMDLAEAAEATRAENPPLVPSEYCRWCSATYKCMGVARLIKEITGIDIMAENEITPFDIYKIPEDKIAEILFDKLPIIERWVASVKDYAQQRAEEKNPLPGTKLVETRERRVWADEKEAQAAFGNLEGAYERKFKTAPQMEKLLGAKKFKEYEAKYVKKVSSGVMVVPADDPRPSARPSGVSEFGAVNINLFD